MVGSQDFISVFFDFKRCVFLEERYIPAKVSEDG